MANANRPFGLRPVGTLNGSPWNAAVRKYAVLAADTTPVFIGDPVILAGSNTLTQTPFKDAPVPIVTKMTADTDVVVGVVVGIEPLPTDLSVLHRKASTLMGVQVCVDPQAIYEVQGDSDTIDAGDVGLNVGLAYDQSGDTTTGTSFMVVDQSDAATTTTLPLQILGVSPNVGNEVDSTATYPVYLVKFNNARFGRVDVAGIA